MINHFFQLLIYTNILYVYTADIFTYLQYVAMAFWL